MEEFAATADIAASTLRAYIARDEADIPVPQATDGSRIWWAKPAVDDWIEQRRRDPGDSTVPFEALTAVLEDAVMW